MRRRGGMRRARGRRPRATTVEHHHEPVVVDPDEARRALELLEERSRQRLAVADLGRAALTGSEPDELASRAVAIAGDSLGAELVIVLELDADDNLVAKAALGFDDAATKVLRIAAEPPTFARASLLAATPLLIADWTTDDRFIAEDLLQANAVRSACSTPIRSPGGPIGVLAALSPRTDAFTQDDCNFLRTVANVLGAANARQKADDERRASEERLRDALHAERSTRRELEESLARLDTLLESSPVAFGFFDAELRFVRLNDRLAALSGLPVPDHLGRTLPDVLPDLWPQLEEGFRSVLDEGRSAVDLEVTTQLASAPGLERHFVASCYPVRAGTGELLGLGALVVDITERKRGEHAAHLMARASELFSRRGDLDEILDEAVALPLPEFADSCQLYLFSTETRPWHAATAQVDDGPDPPALEPRGRYPVDPEMPGAISDAVSTGRAQLVARVTPEARANFARDDEHLGLIEQHGATSAVVAPLRARGETVGLLFLSFTTASGRRYRPDDLSVAEELADRVAHVVETQRLEAEAKRAQQRLDLLARAGALITVELDTGTRMGHFAQLPIPEFANLCALHVLEEDGTFRLEELASDNERLRHVLTRPSQWGAVPPDVPTPNADACARRRAVLIADLPGMLRETLGDGAGDTAHRLGLRSLLCAPLIGADGVAFGTLTFVRGPSGRHYRDDDIPVAEELARRAGASFQHSLRFERERATAELLQRSLLPATIPIISGVETAVRYLPGSVGLRVGGDWYDVVALRGGGALVAIGDVVGHGLAAASSTGQLRAGVHLTAIEGLGPAAVLDRLNRWLLGVPDAEIATVAVLQYDPSTRTLRLASAGHPPPLVATTDGAREFFEGAVGFPLRASAAARYDEVTRPFGPGDVVVLYTDGLIERRGESLDVGLRRLDDALASAPDNLDALAEHLLGSVLPPDGPTDDVALLVLRAVAAPTFLQIELPARAEELAGARESLRSWLNAVGVPLETSRDVVLAANEALANAIEHGSVSSTAVVTLTAHREEEARVVVEVRDRGHWLDRAPQPNRGRGLEVMRAVMDEVAVDPGRNGTTVTLRRAVGG